ncbi:MAG: hypothetical protein COA79_22675 [Planctomycetota bacterium]|nr:MAG: hypothetical protein COA79_22675 [Planctomycetota bacterium]
METFIKLVQVVSGLLTVGSSGIVIYLFIFQKNKIKSVFDLLLNYSFHLTLSELKEKLERLNELRVSDKDGQDAIVNVLSEIAGQIKGNEKLCANFQEILTTIESLIDKRRLTEARKRSLVSELREKLRTLNIDNIDILNGVKI